MRNLSLFELNSLVADLVSTALPQSFWVEAELAESRENGGDLFLSLTQKDETTNTPIAQASAKCWRSGLHFANNSNELPGRIYGLE